MVVAGDDDFSIVDSDDEIMGEIQENPEECFSDEDVGYSVEEIKLRPRAELEELKTKMKGNEEKEINAMQDWLTETLGGLQQLVGKTASMAAAERWYMQRSLQSHLDTVTQEIKSQVSADFRRYIQPPSPATPPHPPWSQAARGLKSKGTPYPGKHPSEILEEMSGGAGTRAASSLGFLQSLSATSNRATQSLSATSSREWP